MLLRRAWLPLFAAGCLGFAARPARAEDGPPSPQDDVRAKIKAQVEKILKLMRENEAALLEASTAGGAAPKGADVKVPDLPPAPTGTTPPPEGGGNGQGNDGASGSQGKGGGSTGPATGEEIRKRLEELINGQQKGAAKIPDELAELVKMVPT